VDFVSISSRSGTDDTQSVPRSVGRPVVRSVVSAQLPQSRRPIGPPLPPAGPSSQLGRLGPSGLIGRGPEGPAAAISSSSVRPFVRSYLPAQMFPTLTYLSERAYLRPAGSPESPAPPAYIYYRIEHVASCSISIWIDDDDDDDVDVLGRCRINRGRRSAGRAAKAGLAKQRRRSSAAAANERAPESAY